MKERRGGDGWERTRWRRGRREKGLGMAERGHIGEEKNNNNKNEKEKKLNYLIVNFYIYFDSVMCHFLIRPRVHS